MRKVRCEDCIRFGHESCRHETYDKCNYYPKQGVQKELKRMENEELIKLIGKMNCSNCLYQCGSSEKYTCKDWEEK